MRFIFLMILSGILISGTSYGQLTNTLSEEVNSFYAETKQVNQFFRRFNSEENIKGVKLRTTDTAYRNPVERKKYIGILFDEENDRINRDLKINFIEDVTNADKQDFLEFHGGDWFAEIFVKFDRNGQEIFVTFFMELVDENLGSKWIIKDVYFPAYEVLYKPDSLTSSRFLHPLSHELDFMNLDKVFKLGEHTGDYFVQGFKPDKLSIFLYELQRSNLKFKYVSGVKFHFFQIEGWYFEISEFNRPGLNRGWLISNLIKLEEGQKEELRNFIYHVIY